MQEMLRRNEIQMMVTNEPIEVEGAVKHRFGGFWTVIFLRKGSNAEKYIEIKEGIRYLDPVYLKDEPITMTRIGQSSRKLAELVFSECGINPKVVQETGHISTLLKYA